MAGFFITGTDTGVGKTWAAVALMRYLRTHGFSVIGMKPIATGCFSRDGALRNDDAVLLQQNASVGIEYAKLNIYSFEPPVSQHIAAKMANVTVEVTSVVRQCRDLEDLADYVLVEGVGGWEAPVSDMGNVSHLAKALGLPVILVVGMKLGCLNHAILTHDAMRRSGVRCAGWVANCLDETLLGLEENLCNLQAKLAFPCLGTMFRCNGIDEIESKCFIERDFFRINHQSYLA